MANIQSGLHARKANSLHIPPKSDGRLRSAQQHAVEFAALRRRAEHCLEQGMRGDGEFDKGKERSAPLSEGLAKLHIRITISCLG